MAAEVTASSLRAAVERIVVEISKLQSGDQSFVAAFDGRTGSGKSTLAELVGNELNAALVPCDDFFAAHISDAGWNQRTPVERAADALDWRRLRVEALEPLIAGREAKWRAFDFVAGPRADGSYDMRHDHTTRAPSPLILIEGAYSTRPELADLIQLSILVEAPETVRHERLAAREDPDFMAAWHARWDEAERHYFTVVRPRWAFGLIVATAWPRSKGEASVARSHFA